MWSRLEQYKENCLYISITDEVRTKEKAKKKTTTITMTKDMNADRNRDRVDIVTELLFRSGRR